VADDAIVITGCGAICSAGETPQAIWGRVCAGRSAIGPIRRWNVAAAPTRVAGEIVDLNPHRLVPDRKLHKLLRRTDVLGLYAAARAIEMAGWQPAGGPRRTAREDENTGVYVASDGAAYEDQYDFLPLLTVASGDLQRFGRELTATVNPMWLLRTLPNNVLCHVGIRYGFKGPNACVTNHSVSGAQALSEAVAALRGGEAERAVVVAHATPVEPQGVLYYAATGLLTSGEALRPFDTHRDGSVLGDGAAAVALERRGAAAARGAMVLGTFLGSGCASDAAGVLGIRADGDSVAYAVTQALADAGLRPRDIGFVVAHGNGTQQSDVSEARALQRVLGRPGPPVTAFKWAFGHTLAASALLDTVLALLACRDRTVPGVATLRTVDPDCDLSVSPLPQVPSSNVALVLSRGFAGLTVALLLRGSDA
jgi:3-oxoacyl-[acyl-carrier-protein] synthase I